MPALTPVRRAALIGCALTLLVVTGCKDNPDVDSLAATQGLPDLMVELGAHEWVLDSTASSIDVGSSPVTLDFHADDTASGQAPCNSYRASVAVDDETLTIADISTTFQACEPAVQQAEAAYLGALTSVREADTLDRDRLVLEGPDGLRLEFDAASS